MIVIQDNLIFHSNIFLYIEFGVIASWINRLTPEILAPNKKSDSIKKARFRQFYSFCVLLGFVVLAHLFKPRFIK